MQCGPQYIIVVYNYEALFSGFLLKLLLNRWQLIAHKKVLNILPTILPVNTCFLCSNCYHDYFFNHKKYIYSEFNHTHKGKKHIQIKPTSVLTRLISTTIGHFRNHPRYPIRTNHPNKMRSTTDTPIFLIAKEVQYKDRKGWGGKKQ